VNAALQEVVERIVDRWLRFGTSPRDAMADDGDLRRRSASERAEVARGSARCIARSRLLAFAGRHAQPRAAELLESQAALDRSAAARQELAVRIAALRDPVERLGVEHSLPDALAAAFLAAYGDDVGAVLGGLGQAAPRTVRANALRVANRGALADELRDEGVATEPCRFAPSGLHVLGEADLFATAAFRRGAFEQQDEASQLAAMLVAPPPRGRVLDFCAGSGGKTLALAGALANRGEVLATDVSMRRLAGLRDRLRRAGANNVRVVGIDETAVPTEVAAYAAHADRILIDAPCSGTGSWRRRPEARWAVDAAGLASLQATQRRLLDGAAAWLKPGARLVYATCSLLPTENEEQVRALLARRDDLEPVRAVEILGKALAEPLCDPSGTWLSLRPDRHGCDGFFAAVLRRKRDATGRKNADPRP
jgi:16S rRNA (cytosine967-C5)-methyltransferase